MSTPAKIIDMGIPTVALVGRVNVGKSSLFNRIIESGQALVSPIAGTTRTRNSAIATWRGKNFNLVDTGGLTFKEKVVLQEDIIAQTEQAIKEADVVVFVTDIKDGILPQEKDLIKMLRKKLGKKPLIFIANKADSPKEKILAEDKEFLKLGLGTPMAVSALNGSGVGDVLDAVYGAIKKTKKTPRVIDDSEYIRVAIIGKPNVGKSSLFNKLIGAERVIVNKMPHTTREPHDVAVEVGEEKILFIDTPGIRRKTKVSGELERGGISKSLETIKRAEIILFVVDASEPISDQDQQLGGLLRERAKSVIIVINKWDLSEDNTDKFRNDVKEQIYGKFPHLNFAPIVFISAKTSYRVHQIFPIITRAHKERATEISSEDLKSFLKNTVRKHLPSRGKGVRHPEVLGLVQVASNPPVFEMYIKAKTSVNISYVNFVGNRLRETFGFFATPVIIKLRKMKRRLGA